MKNTEKWTNMISALNNLAQRVLINWEKSDCSKESFADIALEEISSYQHTHSLEDFEQEIKTWLIKDDLPKQLNVYNDFGQPPLTIFNNGRFVLDLYLWMNVDTSIHSHSFAGAFKVLYGNSLHEVFNIEPIQKFSADVMSVSIKRTELELLSQGDCRKIVRGDSFNHRLIHLDTPTITLCLRTIDDIKATQWHHFENGLSIQKRSLDEKEIKTLFYGQYLYSNRGDEAFDFINQQVSLWDISTAMNLFEQLTYDQMGLDDEIVQEYFNTVLNLYSSTEWFAMYNDFCEESQNSINIDASTNVERLIEHTLNANFEYDKACNLVVNLQKAPLNEIQLMHLETLKTKNQ